MRVANFAKASGSEFPLNLPKPFSRYKRQDPCEATGEAMKTQIALMLAFGLTASGCLSPLTDRLDAVNQQLAHTNQQLDAMNAKLQKLDELDAMNKQLDSVNQQLVKTNAKLELLDQHLTETNTHFVKVERSIVDVNQHLGNVETSINKLEKKIP
jgi:peptidoglycan hydrolase CwlO-like protein